MRRTLNICLFHLTSSSTSRSGPTCRSARWPSRSVAVNTMSVKGSQCQVYHLSKNTIMSVKGSQCQVYHLSKNTIMSVKGSQCQVSKLVDSDACPRPTAGHLPGRRPGRAAGGGAARAAGARGRGGDIFSTAMQPPSSLLKISPRGRGGARGPAGARGRGLGGRALARGAASEKDAKLAQKLGQLQPFTALFPRECMGQLASSGPA
jgi:hypothetical protein